MSKLTIAATEPGNNPVVALPSALASVLVIDDEEIVGNTLRALLQAEGYDAVIARSGEEGVELLRGRQFEVAIADLVMPGMNGIQTLAALKEVDPDVEVILLTGYASVESTIAALRQGASDFLLKPIGMAELRPAIRKALDKRRPKAALPVYEASRPLLGNLNREELIPAALQSAQRTMRATVAALVLEPAEGAGMQVHLSENHGTFTAPVAEAIAGIAMQAGEPLRNFSFEGIPSLRDEAGVLSGSVLAYPLETCNSMIGGLVLWRAQGLAKFSVFDWQQGKLLADEMVIALDNARLYRELSHKVEELKAAKGGVVRAEARARAVLETAQAAVARADARAKSVIETAQEAIVLLDKDGVVCDLNPNAVEMLGRGREQAVGRNFADFAIPPRLQEGFREHREAAYREGRDPQRGCREFRALRAHGEEFPIEISSAVIETPQGRLLSTFARDITERKQALEALRASEEQLRQLTENIHEVFFVGSPNPPRLTYVSPAYEEIWGRRCEELYERADAWIEAIHSEDRETAVNLFTQAFQGKRSEAEYRVVRSDGTVRHIHSQAFPLVDRAGSFYRLVGIAEDVTERKQAERITQESQVKLQAIFDGVETGILVIDAESHRIVDANPLALELVGASRERVVGSVCHKFVCPAEKGRCPVTDLGQVVDESERMLLTATGKKLNIIKTVRPIVIGGRKLLLESFVDITARKRAEQALAEAEEHFHSLFASVPLPTFFFDAETLQYLEVNDAAVSTSGYSRDEFLQMRVTDLVASEITWQDTTKHQALRHQGLERSEGRYRLKDGRLVDVESDFRTMDFRGRRAVLAVSQDVTARKRAENEMAERHRLATLVAEVGVVLTRAESLRQGLQQCTEVLVHNLGAAFARVWTVSEEENVLNLQASAGIYTHLDGGHSRVPIGKFKIGRIAESGEPHLTNSVQEDPWVGDLEWARREGMVAFAGYPLKVEERVLGVVAAFARQPLTEATLQAFASVADNIAQFIKRKRAEEALRESEDRYRDLVESSALLIGMHDAQGKILNANCAAALLLEATTAEDLVGRSLIEYVPPDLLPQFQKYLETVLQEGHAEGLMVIANPGGKRKIIEYRNTLRREAGKDPIIRWTGQDVTERVRAEERLKVAQFSIEHASDAITWLDSDGRIVYVNEETCRSLLRSREELLAATIADINPDFPPGAWQKEWEKVRLGGPATFEARHITKLGRIFPVEVTTSYQVFGGKDYLFTFARDITERKQAEEKVREGDELVRLLLESVPEAVYGIDMNGNCTFYNPSCLQILGYPEAADLRGKNMHDLIHHSRPDGTLYPVEECHIFEAFRRGYGTHIEDEVMWRCDGSSFPAEYWSRPIRRQGMVIGTVVTFVDITERKHAEEQTRLQTAALDSAANGIVIADREGRMLWVNPAFTRLTGYSAGELLGQTMRILKSGEQDPEFYRNLWKTVLAGQVWQGELINRRKDGTLYTDDMTITPVRDARGMLTHFVAIKQDATERQQAEKALEERTVYLNTLFEISPVGIVVLDTEGCIQMSNSMFERLFLYSRQEIKGANLDDLIVPPELAAEGRTLTALCLGGGGAQATGRRRRKDGTLVDTEIYGVPLVIDGRLRGYLGLYQDITTRKQAEADLIRYAEDLEVSKSAQEEHAQELARLVEELGQERDLLRTVMDNLPDCIYYKDLQSRFLRTNSGLARMLGLSDPREAVGKTDFDFFPEEDAKVYLRDEQQVIETGQPLIGRSERIRQLDGQYRWYSTSTVPVRDAQGRVTGLVGITRDMTERMQAEEKIRESEAKYRSLISNIPDVIWTINATLQFAFISPNIERLSGFSLEKVYRCGAALFLECVHPDDVGRVSKAQEALFTRGEPYDVECRVRRKDGEWIWVHDRAVATYEKNGVLHADGVLSDITPSKRAEETLRASEERYRELFENASEIVYTTGLDTRVSSLNRVGQQILGYSAAEVAQLDLQQLVAPKHWELITRTRKRLLAGDSDLTIEVEVAGKDGRPMMLEVKPRLIYRGGKPVGVQGIARDITGRDEAEVELRHAQKLESVGRLAAGIAHEINTPIQFVGDNTRFLQDSFGGLQALLAKYQELRDTAASGAVPPDLLQEVHSVEEQSDCAYLLEEIPKALVQTLDGVNRVATIVRAMKEFAHPEGKEMAAADLNRALLSTLTVARNELKYVADVETEFGDLPLVICNVGDLNQVFLNLLVNGAHAIAENSKGSGQKGAIRVRTRSEGDTVLVTISDTGCGIPESNRGKVFDPFFTTKEVGRGTGQGLAIARSVVVDRHKGTLTFESEVGKGTTFFIRLPIDPGECSKETRTP